MFAHRQSKRWARLTVRTGLALTGLLLSAVAPEVRAQDATFDPAHVWADLAGTWDVTQAGVNGPRGSYATCCAGKGDWVPLTPKYRKIRDEFAKLPEYTREKNTNNMADCITPGVPATLEHPVLFEFLLTPGRVTLIVIDGSVRRIWTDGRQFPKDLVPSPQGYSIGHWENRTLVVQTRAISDQSDLFIAGHIKVNTTTRVLEKFTVVNRNDLELEVTVTDPDIFTRPYTYRRSFTKIPGTFDVGCTANNRDNGSGGVDLTPPSDLTNPPQSAPKPPQ